MNLFELYLKIGVKDEASKSIQSITDKVGGGLKAAAKVGVAAIGTATASIAALTTQAIKGYAEYEQLIGGAELMFGEAFESVKKYSQEAYKTVQMSQNEYLQQVNGFATGLKTALGGNEQAAADLAHKIIKSEADVVAATGNSQEAVQNAFNGIMKSNFTMLDNLQIGITPTKEGFQEVIDKVNEWNTANGTATRYQMGNLADMQSALVDYIDMVGMSGYAQREASKTITGSLASMKAAWSNLVVGVADDTADFEALVNNFVDSAVTATFNIAPRIKVALVGVEKMFNAFLPQITKLIPKGIKKALEYTPKIIKAGEKMLNALLSGFDFKELGKTAAKVGSELVKFIVKNVPKIIEAGVELAKGFGEGFLESLPDILKSVGEGFRTLSPLIGGVVSAFVALKAAMAIKSTVSGLMSVFSALTNPATAVVSVLGLAAAALGAFYINGKKATDITNFMTESQKNLYEEAKKVSDEFEEQRFASEKLVEQEDAHLDKVESLWKELQTLTTEEGRVKTGYEKRADFILHELNSALGTEYERNGEIIEQYKEMKGSIDDIISAKRVQTYLDIYQEDYKKAILAQKSKTDEITAATSAYEKALRTYNAELQAYNDAEELRQTNETYAIFGLAGWYSALEDKNKAERALDSARDILEDAEREYAYINDFISAYENAGAYAASGMGDSALRYLNTISEGFDSFVEQTNSTGDELVKIWREKSIFAELQARQMAERFARGQSGVTKESVDLAYEQAADALDKYIEYGGKEFISFSNEFNEWQQKMTGAMLESVENQFETWLELVDVYLNDYKNLFKTEVPYNVTSVRRGELPTLGQGFASGNLTVNVNAVAQTPAEIFDFAYSTQKGAIFLK